jgi:hypothetical protein
MRVKMESENPGKAIRGHDFKYSILQGFPNSSQEKAWRDFLPRSDWPSHYTTPEFFSEPYWEGKRPFAVLASDGDRIVGVLTGLHEGNHVMSGIPARPQVCFDKSVDYSRAAQALARGLLEEAGSASLISLYSWTPLEALRVMKFRLRTLEGCVVLDLGEGPEDLFRKIHASGRKNIRIAIRKGVQVVEAATEEDLAAYYDVYCQWRQTSRKKIEGEQVPFSVVVDAYRLKNSRRYFLARHDGKVIAGSSVRFAPGGLLEYSGNPSLDEHFLLKPNDLLKWRVIEWGCAQGFPRFSLGGAHLFHLKSGGTVFPVYRHRLDRTWLRRYDLGEGLIDAGRETLRRAPPIDKTVRRFLGKK